MTRPSSDAELIARLREQAESTSDFKRRIAEAKSLRQTDNPEGRTDLYMWPTPEQTIEGRAALRLEALTTARDDTWRAAAEIAEAHVAANDKRYRAEPPGFAAAAYGAALSTAEKIATAIRSRIGR